MGWFRSSSRWGSYLALFALAFQLVVSLGHVHLDGGVPVGDPASIVAKTFVDPATKQSPALADDRCPICALIHLASALLLTAAPALPRFAVFEQVPFAAAVEFDLARPQHYSPLGARAPPLA